MRDMSVSSSRQFAGIHTQLDMPPRLAFFSPFFTGAVRSGLWSEGVVLSNHFDQKLKNTQAKIQSDDPHQQGSDRHLDVLKAITSTTESDRAN